MYFPFVAVVVFCTETHARTRNVCVCTIACFLAIYRPPPPLFCCILYIVYSDSSFLLPFTTHIYTPVAMPPLWYHLTWTSSKIYTHTHNRKGAWALFFKPEQEKGWYQKAGPPRLISRTSHFLGCCYF